MRHSSLDFPAVLVGLITIVVGWVIQPGASSFADDFRAPGRIEGSDAIRQTGWTETASDAAKTFSDGVKGSAKKVTNALTPSESIEPVIDPTSLANQSTIGHETYIAMARFFERSGQIDEALRRYEQALELEPNHLEALIGHAHLLDRLGRLDEATVSYGRAIKAHPNESKTFNDLGLCFARRRMFSESIGSLERALQLQPTRELYRFNLATVLVEQGQVDRALTHMKAVVSEDRAHYNIGYLLYKKGQPGEAVRHFVRAAAFNPGLTDAHTWIKYLQDHSPADSVSEMMIAETAPIPSEPVPTPPSVPKIDPVPVELPEAVVEVEEPKGLPEERIGMRPSTVRHLPPIPSGAVDSSSEPPKPWTISKRTPPVGLKPHVSLPAAPMPMLKPLPKTGATPFSKRTEPRRLPVIQPLPPVEQESDAR